MDTHAPKTHLSQTLGLSTEEQKARYDALAKELLGDKQVLAHIMQGAVAEFRDMEIPDIVQCIENDPQIGTVEIYPGATNGRNTENKILNEGSVTFDVLLEAMVPHENGSIKIFLNIEAQNNFQPQYTLEARGVFYASRLISSQLTREFEDSQYQHLKKVYSIWICFNASENAKNTITEYSFHPTHIYGNYGSKDRCDYMSVIIVGLDKTAAEYRNNRLLDMLTVLFTERRSALEKEEILYERFGMENTIPRKEKLTNMCNLSDGIYQEGERKGEQRGELKALCNAVVNGMLTLANALKLSGCSQDEFSAWMKQFHPDYKI